MLDILEASLVPTVHDSVSKFKNYDFFMCENKI